MITFPDIIFGVIIPVLLSGTLTLFAYPPWNRETSRPALLVWATCLGTAVGFVGLRGIPTLPPQLSTDCLLLIDLLAIPLALLLFSKREEGISLSLAVLGVGAAVTLLTVFPLFAGSSDAESVLLQTLVSIAGFYAFWRGSLFFRAEGSVRGLTLEMIGLSVSVSVLLVFSGSLALGQLAGALAASVGPMLVWSFLRKDLELGTAAISAFSLLVFAHLLQGYHYSDMPRSSALLLALAPLVGAFAGRHRQLAGCLVGFISVGIAAYQYLG